MKASLAVLIDKLIDRALDFARRHPFLTLFLLLLPIVLPLLAQVKLFFGLLQKFSEFTRWLASLPDKAARKIKDALKLSTDNGDRLALVLGGIWKALLFVVLPLPLSLLLFWVGPANETAVSEEQFRGDKRPPDVEFETKTP